jgi:hypothetical protein
MRQTILTGFNLAQGSHHIAWVSFYDRMIQSIIRRFSTIAQTVIIRYVLESANYIDESKPRH